MKDRLEALWPGLSESADLKESELTGKDGINLFITSTMYKMRENLKHVVMEKDSKWGIRITSDAGLMDAWLSNDLDIYDKDVDGIREGAGGSKFHSLGALVEPPELLVIILGVKAARNSAMPEVLRETLTRRKYYYRPTWVVEQPVSPLMEGHISFDEKVHDHIKDWDTVALDSRSYMAVPVPQASCPSKPIIPNGWKIKSGRPKKC